MTLKITDCRDLGKTAGKKPELRGIKIQTELEAVADTISGLLDHGEALDEIVRKALETHLKILMLPEEENKNHPNYLSIWRLKREAAKDAMDIAVKVDESRWRRRNPDGLSKLIEAIAAAEGKRVPAPG